MRNVINLNDVKNAIVEAKEHCDPYVIIDFCLLNNINNTLWVKSYYEWSHTELKQRGVEL